jgi:hypothetical protein
MAEWTPEATDYLDGYLKQVRAFARRSGEDAEEIASGLREHILDKVSERAPSIVTLDAIRQILKDVGRPEDLIATLEPKVDTTMPLGEDDTYERSDQVAHSTESPAEGPNLVRRVGCIFAWALAFTCAAVVVGIACYAAYVHHEQSEKLAAEEKAVARLREIAREELKYLNEKKVDSDGDGIPDFATLEQLTGDPVAADVMRTSVDGYTIKIMLEASSKNHGKAGFHCAANPSYALSTTTRAVFISDDGRIQYGVLPNLWGQKGFWERLVDTFHREIF